MVGCIIGSNFVKIGEGNLKLSSKWDFALQPRKVGRDHSSSNSSQGYLWWYASLGQTLFKLVHEIWSYRANELCDGQMHKHTDGRPAFLCTLYGFAMAAKAMVGCMTGNQKLSYWDFALWPRKVGQRHSTSNSSKAMVGCRTTGSSNCM